MATQLSRLQQDLFHELKKVTLVNAQPIETDTCLPPSHSPHGPEWLQQVSVYSSGLLCLSLSSDASLKGHHLRPELTACFRAAGCPRRRSCDRLTAGRVWTYFAWNGAIYCVQPPSGVWGVGGSVIWMHAVGNSTLYCLQMGLLSSVCEGEE